MKVFIAGICGTFMAGIAQLAQASGHNVEGCDNSVYPPMSTLLRSEGIDIMEGYHASHLQNTYDQVIIGNALSRGNPLIEGILDQNINYQSGPQWLHDNLLRDRKVIAVAGTHGKTSTSAMVNWIMHVCGKLPGYLIGGQPGNFSKSAELGQSDWFVIEADEYDTAFFDKRSKFVHYNPSMVILNNLEFDHADIFNDLEQIKTQFHHLLRIVPSSGFVIVNQDDPNCIDVLKRGCWSQIIPFSTKDPKCQWFAETVSSDFSKFEVRNRDGRHETVHWQNIGYHNMQNALAAIVATCHTGIELNQACDALFTFKPTNRRLQLLFNYSGVYLYEDFAHHPTAISVTIDAVKSKHTKQTIIAVVELRSNTMKRGCHGNLLGQSFNKADKTIIYQSEKLDWSPEDLISEANIRVCYDKDELIDELDLRNIENSVIICMSNGSFDAVPNILRKHLETVLIKSTQ